MQAGCHATKETRRISQNGYLTAQRDTEGLEMGSRQCFFGSYSSGCPSGCSPLVPVPMTCDKQRESASTYSRASHSSTSSRAIPSSSSAFPLRSSSGRESASPWMPLWSYVAQRKANSSSDMSDPDPMPMVG